MNLIRQNFCVKTVIFLLEMAYKAEKHDEKTLFSAGQEISIAFVGVILLTTVMEGLLPY